MSEEVFCDIPLTFGSVSVNRKIDSYLAGHSAKGYLCVVDFNVLSNVFWDDGYRKIILNSSFNTCDGSLIAFLVNLKNGKYKYDSYNGPEIFKEYIGKQGVKHLIIGGSSESYLKLTKLVRKEIEIAHVPLPILSPEEFDYDGIANCVNKSKPQLIWVMLGCPKQEIFIRNLFMKIEQGLLIGSGAAMNFHIGEMKNRKFSIFGLRFIWLSRLISEPIKQSKRICKFFMIVPKILKKL